MRRSFSFRIAGIAAIALLALVVRTQASSVLDDCEGGTNQNKFLAYWYLYDDAKDGGNSTITNATKNADDTYDFLPTEGEGNPNGTPGYAAKIDYQMGDTEPSCGEGCTYGNMVGIGTQFTTEGNVLDLTGATKITYWAKASAPMTVRVEVATSVVTNFAYHRTEHDVTTSWAQYEVVLTEGLGIAQPSWNTEPVEFDPSTAEKLQWQVSMDDANPESGSLWLDDIVVEGYTWTPPSACASCVKPAGSGASLQGMLLSDMDTKPYNQNALGYYWYAYNDAEGRSVSVPGEEYSEIIQGVNIDADDPTKPILVIDGNGYQSDNGAWIDFQLGPVYEDNGQKIKPFVGLGTRLADNLGTEFYDAKSDGVTGIYFDYMTGGDVDFIRLEVNANQDFGNAGIVHHMLLEGTGGEWKGAEVPFDALKLPDWEEVAAMPPSLKELKLEELEQIQWAFQGDAAAKGELAVDNVKLIGASSGVISSVAAHNAGSMTIQRRGHVLAVTLPNAMAQAVSLLGVNGAVVGQARATSMAGTYELSVGDLAPGTYLLRVGSRNEASGMTTPVNLVR